MNSKHLCFLHVICIWQPSLLPTAILLRSRTANTFISYRCSMHTANMFTSHSYILLRRRTTNVFISYSCFIHTANIFTSYSCSMRQTFILPTCVLCLRQISLLLQLLYAANIFTSYSCSMPTANIFTSYSWSITIMNGKHIYFYS